MLSVLPVLLAVELLMKLWPFLPASALKILGRSIIRGFAYSPAVAEGHGVAIIAAPFVALSREAKAADFGYGIPAAILTLIIFAFSIIRWREKRNDKEA
ncbi:hypothetical protein AYO49_03870 [Verrucomicrobiaceae bacterium SCGC AG-212-N21]|nr:hypothetical protein AYO49_03870 [Verrucomicrobiaceae bacterium SCGC AG-212-N21]